MRGLTQEQRVHRLDEVKDILREDFASMIEDREVQTEARDVP